MFNKTKFNQIQIRSILYQTELFLKEKVSKKKNYNPGNLCKCKFAKQTFRQISNVLKSKN